MNNLNGSGMIEHKKRQSDIVKKHKNINSDIQEKIKSIQFKNISKLESYFQITNGSYDKDDLNEIETYINSLNNNNELKKLYTFISSICNDVDIDTFINFVEGFETINGYNLRNIMIQCFSDSEKLAYNGLSDKQIELCRGDSDYTLRFLCENGHYDKYYLIKFLNLLGNLF